MADRNLSPNSNQLTNPADPTRSNRPTTTNPSSPPQVIFYAIMAVFTTAKDSVFY